MSQQGACRHTSAAHSIRFRRVKRRIRSGCDTDGTGARSETVPSLSAWQRVTLTQGAGHRRGTGPGRIAYPETVTAFVLSGQNRGSVGLAGPSIGARG
jgi:hypothetical protein